MSKPTICTTCSRVPDGTGLWRMSSKVHLCRGCVKRISGREDEAEFLNWMARQVEWKEKGGIL